MYYVCTSVERFFFSHVICEKKSRLVFEKKKGAKNTHIKNLLFSARERKFTRDTSRAFSLPPLENESAMMSLPNMPGMTSMGATTWSQQVK